MSPAPPPAPDNVTGADLSHSLERLALALAQDDPDDRRATAALRSVSGGHREATALALSYVFRRRELGDVGPPIARAIELLTAALWD